ncbi:transposase [Streptomyces pseudovenezuelae]|uniref:Transposase n=1 Tax=Streptomyces pseudovenezuelae TaxID=67350 RepID=A0ABT6M0T4_9ACTN|nr:transposase [Streptomyces pseudovenezuelae]
MVSLHPESHLRIPVETVRTAWAACPKGTPVMLMRDRLDVVFADEDFADLYPTDGRPALSPGQLALVSVLQFAENLSDRRAADAVRTRIDWKYGLGLEPDDPGFDYSVLCEFRARLAEGDAAERLLQVMLQRLVEAGLLRAGGRQRTDSTHVLAAVRNLGRLELVGESLRAALEDLAEADEQWLLPLLEPEWGKRYGRRVEIGKVPGGKPAVAALGETIGRDGAKILTALWGTQAPPGLRRLAQVEILRRIWVHQYYWDSRGKLRWRKGKALPPASLRFDSTYDTDAHYCVKRGTAWRGYRVHFSETCDDTERPDVVVHVATTIATVQDGELTPRIHDDLAGRNMLPDEHVVDSAYVTAGRIERARRVHGVELLSPLDRDHSHQARAGEGFDKSCFAIDWDEQEAACPQGHVSTGWGPMRSGGYEYIQIGFDQATCLACPVRSGPVRSGPVPVHQLPGLSPLDRITAPPSARDPDAQPPRPGHRAMAAPLRDPRWNRIHALRERTGPRPRRARYRGVRKVHVQPVLTALACNVARIADWLNTPAPARRRATRLHTLYASAAHP